MKHNFGLRITLLLFSFAGVSIAHAQFGVAASDGAVICAVFPTFKEALPHGVTIVFPDQPSRTLSASLTSQLRKPCKMIASTGLGGPYFAIRFKSEQKLEAGSLGIVLLTPPWRVSKNGSRLLGIAPSSESVSFRSCTSTEGVHLTVWTGTPLLSRRLWHEYVYLGYDVEPTCSPKDYE